MANVSVIARTALALSLSTALLAGCQPPNGPAIPSTQPPVTMPGTTTPVQPGPTGPATPAGPTAPLTALNAQVVIPAASVSKLRASMRTQSVADETAQALGALQLNIGGQLLTADQFSFDNAGYDSMGRLVATLKVNGMAMAPGAILTLSTASGSFALKSVVSTSGSVTVDVNSTAKALIVETMQKEGKTVDPDAIPAAAVALITAKLTNLLAGSATADILNAASLVSAISQVASAVADGKGADPDTITQINVSTGGGSSSGSNVGGSNYEVKNTVKALDWQAADRTLVLSSGFDGGTHMAKATSAFVDKVFDVEIWNADGTAKVDYGTGKFFDGMGLEGPKLPNLPAGHKAVHLQLKTGQSYKDKVEAGKPWRTAYFDNETPLETTFMLDASDNLVAVSNFIGPHGTWWQLDPEVASNPTTPIASIGPAVTFPGATSHYYYKNSDTAFVEFFVDANGLLGAIIPNLGEEIDGYLVYKRSGESAPAGLPGADVPNAVTLDNESRLMLTDDDLGKFNGWNRQARLFAAPDTPFDQSTSLGDVNFAYDSDTKTITATMPVGGVDYSKRFRLDDTGSLFAVSTFAAAGHQWYEVDPEVGTPFTFANPNPGRDQGLPAEFFAASTKRYYYLDSNSYAYEFFFNGDGELIGAILPDATLGGYVVLGFFGA